jgi:hypothetical protein
MRPPYCAPLTVLLPPLLQWAFRAPRVPLLRPKWPVIQRARGYCSGRGALGHGSIGDVIFWGPAPLNIGPLLILIPALWCPQRCTNPSTYTTRTTAFKNPLWRNKNKGVRPLLRVHSISCPFLHLHRLQFFHRVLAVTLRHRYDSPSPLQN